MLVIMVTKEMITVCAGSTCGGDDIFKACDNVGDVGNDDVCVVLLVVVMGLGCR